MKKWIIFTALLSGALFAQGESDGNIITGSSTTKLNLSKEIQQDEANVGKGAAKQMKQQKVAAVQHMQPQDNEVMLINPQDRAQDFKQAYDFLKDQKAASRVNFMLKDGQMLSKVIDINVMKGGSLLIFQINTTQGIRYQVVKVEDIESVGHE